MIKAIDLRKGRTIVHKGDLAVVHDVQHVVKGNKRSYMQAKLKSLKTGTILEVRFTVDERVEVPFVESKDYEFLYRDGDDFIVMDLETYDQIPISSEIVGDIAQWLKPNEKVSCQLYEGRVISFEPPMVVELTVSETTPVVKGATATNQNKDAILETGVKVKVPPFISNGEVIRVDTRTGEYIERAK
ncbi:MAG: elongation factor P [Phycisphaerae bacterium]